MYSLVVRIDTEDLRTSGEEKFEESFLANWGENILCNIILGLMYTRIPEEGHLVPLYTTFWNVKIRQKYSALHNKRWTINSYVILFVQRDK